MGSPTRSTLHIILPVHRHASFFLQFPLSYSSFPLFCWSFPRTRESIRPKPLPRHSRPVVSKIKLATKAVQPVWWLAPRPSPLSP